MTQLSSTQNILYPGGENWVDIVQQLQDSICEALETVDGRAKFKEDDWQREEGGGGKTRVIENGNIFEKGGVNISVVHGDVTGLMRQQLNIEGSKWFASGMSIVIHPLNPFVPTVHCNYRMFLLYDEEMNIIDQWFGGGTDLTPYYLIEEDAVHFHSTYKNICEAFETGFYNDCKLNCDDYFVNRHRNNERRGIGGIFYDYKRPDENKSVNDWMNFGNDCGKAFTEAYIPIVKKRYAMPFNAQNRYWQEIRRGRYIEFNLIHDRGTLFGLKTNGRTESILMSLPPTARFDYNFELAKGSEEDKLLQACLHPRQWV
ncbi:MAG: oxygen-dependent coproporphyrinogen oxidase [Ginsengibacter sp.]